jgi:hypothetical protein
LHGDQRGPPMLHKCFSVRMNILPSATAGVE